MPHPALVAHAQQRAENIQNRIADRITAYAGSMHFVYLHIALFAVWMLAIEESPWPTLTLIVSLEAIFLSTFVMISQNRADDKRQVIASAEWRSVQLEEKQKRAAPGSVRTDPAADERDPSAHRGAHGPPGSPGDLRCRRRMTPDTEGAARGSGIHGIDPSSTPDARHDLVRIGSDDVFRGVCANTVGPGSCITGPNVAGPGGGIPRRTARTTQRSPAGPAYDDVLATTVDRTAQDHDARPIPAAIASPGSLASRCG
jgi:hypothetical protein